MIIHTVIESFAAYKAVRASDPQGARVWWTTSTAVIDELIEKKEVVRSLEINLPQKDIDHLAQAGYLFSANLGDDLNRLCPWRGGADIGIALAYTLNQCFFVTLYKGMLLAKLIQYASASGEYVTCVGDVATLGQFGLSMTYGRFDTLYASIAEANCQQLASVIPFALSTHELERKHQAVVNRKMDRYEKFLSIFSNSPGAFFFKVWKKLCSKRWFQFRQIRFLPFARKRFFINGGCELLDETVFEILLRGGSVGLLDELPKAMLQMELNGFPNQIAVIDACRNRAMEAMHKFEVEPNPFIDACLKILCGRLCTSLSRLNASIDHLTVAYNNLLAHLSSKDCILTSGFYSVEERLFYDFCKANGVKIVAFEHGITMGLSRWTDYCDKYYALRFADIGVYHNNLAAEQMGRIVPEQVRLVAGLPRATIGMNFKEARRWIGRKWLGIERCTHVVMYVADLEKNNYFYGPYIENDLQYSRKTETVIRKLCTTFPDSLIILKLYPTQRYVDVHDFPLLRKEFRNLRIVKDMDFRFIGHSADLIVTSSSQSTLGWVVGTGVPCLFAEFEWAPTHLGGLRMKCPDIQNLEAMIVLDTRPFISRINYSFVSKLFN